jgi:hypothetical protein
MVIANRHCGLTWALGPSRSSTHDMPISISVARAPSLHIPEDFVE